MPVRTVAKPFFCDGPFARHEFQVNWFKGEGGTKAELGRLTVTAVEIINWFLWRKSKEFAPCINITMQLLNFFWHLQFFILIFLFYSLHFFITYNWFKGGGGTKAGPGTLTATAVEIINSFLWPKSEKSALWINFTIQLLNFLKNWSKCTHPAL